jgi:hypothetical protein
MDAEKFEELLESLREADSMLADIGAIVRAGPYTGDYVECVRQAYADACKYRETVRALSVPVLEAFTPGVDREEMRRLGMEALERYKAMLERGES